MFKLVKYCVHMESRKRGYLRLSYRYVRKFFEVLSGKTSLKLVLAIKFPHFYKLNVKEGEVLKWKGVEVKLPKSKIYNQGLLWEEVSILSGRYLIPECHVRHGDIVFDVGAHLGFFSYYALQNGAKEIYAFEPNPYVFEILKENSRMWSDRIKPFQLALFSTEEDLEFFIVSELDTVSTLVKDREGSALGSVKYCKVIKVRTTTVDNFVRDNKIERVDFIKIDAEGSEKEILKGAEETIKNFKPRMVVAAYHFPDDKERIPELVFSIRNDYNFKIVNKGEEDLFFW